MNLNEFSKLCFLLAFMLLKRFNVHLGCGNKYRKQNTLVCFQCKEFEESLQYPYKNFEMRHFFKSSIACSSRMNIKIMLLLFFSFALRIVGLRNSVQFFSKLLELKVWRLDIVWGNQTIESRHCVPGYPSVKVGPRGSRFNNCRDNVLYIERSCAMPYLNFLFIFFANVMIKICNLCMFRQHVL